MRKGWEVKKLGDILRIQNGYAFNSKQFTNDEGTPLIRIRDIKNGVSTQTKFNGSYDKKYEVKAGDFLIGMDGEFGCYEWKGNIALLNQRVCRLQDFNKNVDARYLFLGINKYLKAIEDVTAFATVKHISSKQIEAIEIPLPPLEEQQRIVTILDETFKAIDKAKANTEQNLKNAKELYESSKKEIFDKLKAEKLPIASVCNEIFAGGDAPKDYSKTKNDKHNIPIIANAVKNNGLYGYSNKVRVFLPSITIAARGSGTGHTEVRYETFLPIVRLIVLTPNTEIISLEFLKYSVKNLDILSSGSAIPQLTVPMLKEYSISLPTLKVQQTIVSKLDALKEQTKKLEGVYTQKLQDLEELKKSVLQKAFSGELTVKSVEV